NGPERFSMDDSLAAGYDGNGEFRGNKRDSWEGGTRVPFLVRWPGVVTPGVTDFSCMQGDFFASMADFLRYDLAPGEAADVESFLPILEGRAMPTARRPGLIEHSINGQFAIVDPAGEFKLIDGTGSGGYTTTYDANNVSIVGVGGTIRGTPRQLFNLLTDPGEKNNLLINPTAEALAKEAELLALLNDIRGNTTFGTDGDSNVPPLDSDGDGMSNFYEGLYPSALDRDDPNDAAEDAEPDGLTNLEEFNLGTSPIDPDSDDDLLGDFEEVVTFGTLPLNPFSDGDSLSDGDEVYLWGTHPLATDTDGDGAPDDFEITVFTSPLSAASVPSNDTTSFVLTPSEVVRAGFNGNANDPAFVPFDFNVSDYSIRERSGNFFERRNQMFFKFDLSSVSGQLQNANLRIHQINRLNTVNSADIELATVDQAWAATPGSYPVFSSTPVSNETIIGNNSDFGTAIAASGFYSGTPGVPGTDAGFDVTSLVEGWFNGSTPNNGLRLAFPVEFNGAAAFSVIDNPETTNQNEAFALLVDVSTIDFRAVDDDDDFLLDDFELTHFGNLSQRGDDDTDGDGLSNLVEQAIGTQVNGIEEARPFGFEFTGSSGMSFFYHRYLQAGLGVEVAFSEDLETWHPYTKYFSAPSASSVSDLGPDYQKVTLVSHQQVPEKLFVVFGVHTLRP
ncbi:MAG: DNRLRE domain-containing protein, partial [Verrucomicrobiales bacterium]